MAPLSRLQQSNTEEGGRGCMTPFVGDKNTVNVTTLACLLYDWLVEQSALTSPVSF